MTKHREPDREAARDRPVIQITEEMIEAGTIVLQDSGIVRPVANELIRWLTREMLEGALSILAPCSTANAERPYAGQIPRADQ